jgi:DnaJ-domain-containing protein 1
MVRHHDSGLLEGRSLKGRFAGRELSSLNDREQLEFLDELRGTDSQGALLMEAFLDRRSPDWRDRQAKNRARHESSGPRGGMTTSEAYDILGLKPDAKPDQIRAAHRRLMMKFHPDQGGSTYFAARINEAKEILLVRKSKDGA